LTLARKEANARQIRATLALAAAMSPTAEPASKTRVRSPVPAPAPPSAPPAPASSCKSRKEPPLGSMSQEAARRLLARAALKPAKRFDSADYYMTKYTSQRSRDGARRGLEQLRQQDAATQPRGGSMSPIDPSSLGPCDRSAPGRRTM